MSCPKFEMLVKDAKTQNGDSLYDLSHQGSVLVVFLRHFGCTFCRETVAELSKVRRQFEINGVRIVFVHMESPEEGDAFFQEFAHQDMLRISDPQKRLYEACELKKARAMQMFSPRVILRALQNHLRGYRIGASTTDQWQMPGAFLLSQGKVERSYRHHGISDRPDYLELAECSVENIEFARPSTS